MGDSSSGDSMRALRPQIDATSDARALWRLPDWDAYSAASSPLSASSASSHFSSVQRSPVALASTRVSPSAAKRQSALRQLHQRYAAQRQATHSPSQADAKDDAVAQWLALLSRKVALLAAACDRDASADEQLVQAELTAWRLGDSDSAFAALAPARVKVNGSALERALAALSVGVTAATRRATDHCERSLAQLQQFHHETLQRVADEAVEEVKLVRARHQTQRERLEAQLREATRDVGEWKQRALDVEHQSARERETIEFQAATFRDKFERLSVRFDEDIVQITRQLEAARQETRDAQSCREALEAQRSRDQDALAHETQHWRATVEQMRRDHDAVVQDLTREKQTVATQLENVARQHAREVERLRNRLEMRAEDDYHAAVASDQLVALQRRHEQQLASVRVTYEQRVSEQGRAVADALEELRVSRVHTTTAVDAETQTEANKRGVDASVDATVGTPTDAELQLRALSRKCRALENLLDRKFEEQSEHSAASLLGMSCGSSSSQRSQFSDGADDAVSTGDNATSDARREAIGGHKKTWLSSSPRTASFTGANDTTLFTDVNTTMRHNETWDHDSVTSTDTFERLSLSTSRSRPHSAGGISNAGTPASGVPTNDDILALVRKLESYTASVGSSLPEPEAEHQTMVLRTPESRTLARRTHPPPVHRTRKETAALRPTRKPNAPLTAKPLRNALVSDGSSLSSASPSSVNNHRQRPTASKLPSARNNSTRPPPSRATPFY